MANGLGTLRDIVAAQARRFEKQPFLEFREARFSYADVDDRTDRVATGLSRLGLRAGERVGLVLPNRPELLFFLWGTPKIGAVAVPLDPALPPEDIASALRSVAPSAVVTEARHAPQLQSRLTGIDHWIVVDEPSFQDDPFRGLERGAAVLGFWPDLDPGAPALIVFAHDRRRQAKGVVLSHRNLVAATAQLVQPFRVDETDRFLCLLPLSSVSAQVLLALIPWVAGATTVMADGSASDPLETVDSSRASVLAVTPRLFERLSHSAQSCGREISSLRLAICCSGVVGQNMLVDFESRYDALVVEGYGVPEATCLVCANPYTGVRKAGSLGLPLPGQQCRLVDAGGDDVATGKTGEILVRGPNIMLGYFADSEATSTALRGGWLHTGDFGYVDTDGYYYLSAPPEPPPAVLVP